VISTERNELFLNPSKPGLHKNGRSRHHSGDAAEGRQQLRAAPEDEEPDRRAHSDGGVPTEAEHSHVAAAHVIRGEAGDVVAGDGHGDHFTVGKNHDGEDECRVSSEQ
jgi:hypothetical protein